MNTVTLLLLVILSICIGFVFGFIVVSMITLDAINKPKKKENKE